MDVDEVVLTGVHVCATAAITVLLPTRPSRLKPPPVAVGQDPADLPGAHGVGEPGDADLALAAGEAAERGDVGAGR